MFVKAFPLFFLLTVMGHSAPLLSTNDLHHIHQALDSLIMTETDLGFDKDVSEHKFVLPDPLLILDHPLEMPKIGDDYLSTIRKKDTPAFLALTNQKFGTNLTQNTTFPSNATERIRFAAEFWTETLQTQRHPEELPIIRQAIAQFAHTDAEKIFDDFLAEPETLDPEPNALRGLSVLESIPIPDQTALMQHIESLLTATRSDDPKITWGTLGDDVYTNRHHIIIDPGGNDTYTGLAGVGLESTAIIIDQGGDDRYLGNGLLGPGSAVFGNSIIIDLAGDDHYRCSHLGIASALGGFSWVEDRAGNDTYEAKAFSQGAATAGLACLVDHQGDDTYKLGYLGQAYAGVLGQGYLIDYDGNDLYLAGGHYVDHGHHEDRFMSMAQGFTIGMRPYAAGGIAGLFDLAGNDVYKADVWGQAVSYWYALGMLIDGAGNDTYTMYHYGQGSGIHLSSALLADLGGNDFYTGYALAQGNAHDYAVGMLLDHAGNDHYTANHYSQGRGMTNGFGMLLDRAGNDGYFSVKCDRSQGIGSDGWQREFGSIALLLDLLGKDVYSCGGKDNFNLIRPDHGVIYDAE